MKNKKEIEKEKERENEYKRYKEKEEILEFYDEEINDYNHQLFEFYRTTKYKKEKEKWILQQIKSSGIKEKKKLKEIQKEKKKMEIEEEKEEIILSKTFLPKFDNSPANLVIAFLPKCTLVGL